MERPKILFIITKSNWGGAQRYVYDLALFCKKGGYPVAAALGGKGELAQKLDSAGIRTISIPALERDVSISKEIKVFFFLVGLFRKEKPTVVHLNSSKAGGLGVLAARLTGIQKIIFTAHGWAFNEERSILSRLLIMLLHWITVVLSTKTIVVSETMYSQVRHLPFVRSKIEVIYNGIENFSTLSKDDGQLRIQETCPSLRKPLEKKPKIIGTIAELHRTKGIRYLIEAVEKLISSGENIIAIVLGEGEDRLNLERLIREKRLEDSFFLPGHFENARTYLKSFDIFVLPSLSEALGYVLLEAGLAELPTVASAAGGIPEIIDSGKNGLLVPARDPGALADALHTLLHDRERASVYGTALKEKVARLFSKEKMLRQTERLYQS